MKRISVIIVMIFLLLPLLGSPKAGNYIFEHIQTSNHWINSIYQDRDGFIWVSSRNGLFRYLGDSPDDYEIVSEGDTYNNILQDRDGMMWVKRRNGYVIYNPYTCAFAYEDETAAILGSESWIDVMAIDAEGRYWWTDGPEVYYKSSLDSDRSHAGTVHGRPYDMYTRDDVIYLLTYEGLVYRYSLDGEGGVNSYPVLDPDSEDAMAGNHYHCIFADSRHNIWISQGAMGVWYFPYDSETASLLSASSGGYTINRGFICDIEEDAEGNIWLASDHGGITICAPEGNVLVNLKNDVSDENTIASNGVYAIMRDRYDNMWVGHSKHGFSIYRGANKTWSMNHINVLHKNNLPDDINTICVDDHGDSWFGTDGHGLIRVDGKTGTEQIYNTSNSSLRSNVITDIHCDPHGRIWIGTFYGGLSCIEDGNMVTYSYDGCDSCLSSSNVWSIDNDIDGNIWIGTLEGGVQMIDPETMEIKTFNSHNAGLSNDSIHELKCGDDGKIYIATAYGLNIFDPHERSIKAICRADEMVQEILTGLEVDNDGLVWLDEDGILQVYDPEADVFYTPQHPSLKAVRGIEASSSGEVWVITDNMLCRCVALKDEDGSYDFKVSTFSFPQQKGLHFNQRSICQAPSGEYLIGSYSGYMTFSPNRYSSEKHIDPTPLFFVTLNVGSQEIRPGVEYDGTIILDKALEYTDEIVLDHHSSHISVEFASLDYLSIANRNLFYKMDGLSDEWIAIDKDVRKIGFTNLPTGKYTLFLAADTADSSSMISLGIRVRPPWWASWWAILIYVTLASCGVFTSWAVYRQRKRHKEKLLEKAMKRERREYVNEMKMQFFTNISHDFRTPLTLILTPVEEMISKRPELKDDVFISTIHRNALRLLNLVNEVLDLRRMEMYGNELQTKTADLVTIVRDTVTSFRMMAESQGINLDVDCQSSHLMFDFDESKVVKVLTNLLSNAFKFTPKGGDILVRLNTSGGIARVEVCDTGTGVADKDKRRIFDRFYQAKDSPAGSGIGLHVAYEFVVLHGGELTVSDNEPQGSIFAFTLPVRSTVDANAIPEVTPSISDATRPTVLVVDDNEDFRAFLKTSLYPDYNVLEASDGAEALKVVRDADVDVVVSDVMMPNMDGTEFCQRMKADINTSHIPVILLTAKAMQDDECYGLESGADDYLTKPFNMSILRLRIAKFLEWKNRSKRLFEQELEVTTEQITLTSMDDRLLQQAINVINENISNTEFSVSELSAALCMHRANLYKKLLYITGKTPVEFIRAIRLKRAAALLETDGVYISEIAYMVGFNSPKVFAGHFKEEFGCSPTEYRKKHLSVS